MIVCFMYTYGLGVTKDYSQAFKWLNKIQDEAEAMEQRLSAILQAHDAELPSVYAAIVDKKDDYCEQ